MPVHYRVHEAAVQSFNLPGQPVYEDVVWRTARTTRILAQLYAPKRSHRLANSIAASRPKPISTYRIASSVSASIGYAVYVHDGVAGRIYPTGGKYLTVPQRRGSLSGSQLKATGGSGKAKLYFLAKSVKGQDAQPFLADALKQAMRTNDVLHYRVG